MSNKNNSSKRRRSSSPDDTSQQSIPIVDFSETITLLGMTNFENKPLTCYYNDLKEQAEKCGIRCCKERIVRDRLIQAITNEDILLELGWLEDPTAEDVLAKYHEVFKDQTAFPLIFPYLSLGNIISVMKASTRLEFIAQDYIHAEYSNITIDKETLKRHPLKTNKEIYDNIQSASCITLRAVGERNIAETLSFFKYVKILTIVDTEIQDNIIFPQSLFELKLIKVDIDELLLTELLTTIGDRVLSLHLDLISQEDCLQLDLNKICPRLGALEMYGRNLKLELASSIIILKLVADTFQGDVNSCYSLQKLHLECGRYVDTREHEGVGNFKHMDGLESLVVKPFTMRLPKSLQNLRIIDAVDPKHKSYLEQLKLKTLDVYYYEYADKPNLIVDLLNDDCLLTILKFLGLQDRIFLAATHPRLCQLIGRHTLSTFELSWSNFDVLKKNPVVWNQAAPFVHDLTVYINDLTYFSRIKNDLRSLKYLRLGGIKVTADWLAVLPTSLEGIDLSRCSAAAHPVAIRGYLVQLKNLREITVQTDILNAEMLSEILEQNGKTLEHISLTVSTFKHWAKFQNIWKLIGSLENLSHFTLEDENQCEEGEYSPNADKNCLPFIFSSVGKRLQKLTLTVLEKDYKRAINANNFPNLQELVLIDKSEPTDTEWVSLGSLRKLTTFKIGMDCAQRFHSFKSIKENHIEMIKGWPELVNFTTFGYKSTPEFRSALRKYLKRSGRKLNIKEVVKDFNWMYYD